MAHRLFAARVAPQRSTQYGLMAERLARPELLVSPLAPSIRESGPLTLGGQRYLRVEMSEPPATLPHFATLSDWFELHEELGGQPGPFLRPLEPAGPLRFPDELVEARRYRGKTNELFTFFLVNLARWSHGGTARWLLDPMAGGGTTLFTALRLGLNGMGVEKDKQSLSGTDTFLKQFLRNEGIRHKREQQKRQAGYRVRYLLPEEQSLVLALGDTREAGALLEALPGGPHPELVVVDLPYAIQHGAGGSLVQLLRAALPAWCQFAAPGATLVLAWNATSLPRARMLEWVEASGWRPFTGGPYEEIAHRVDRVIKVRDVIVARREER